MVEAAGGGLDVIYTHVNHALAAGSAVEELRAAGSAGLRLTGNELANRIFGGSGADSFVFGFGAGDDVITDFTAEDSLRLNDGLWGGVASSAAAVVTAHAHVIAGDVVIDLGQGHSVTLDGISSLAGLASQITLF